MSASIPQSTELGKRPRITAEEADLSYSERASRDQKALLSLDTTEEKRQRIDTHAMRPATPEQSVSSTAMPTTTAWSQKSEYTSEGRTKEAVIKMLRMLGEEFNCNHQADLTTDDNGETQAKIFTRASEQREI